MGEADAETALGALAMGLEVGGGHRPGFPARFEAEQLDGGGGGRTGRARQRLDGGGVPAGSGCLKSLAQGSRSVRRAAAGECEGREWDLRAEAEALVDRLLDAAANRQPVAAGMWSLMIVAEAQQRPGGLAVDTSSWFAPDRAHEHSGCFCL